MQQKERATLYVGTQDALHLFGNRSGREFAGRSVSALAQADGALAMVLDGRELFCSDSGKRWQSIAILDSVSIECVLWDGRTAWLGTSEAHLYRVRDGQSERLESFDSAPGRADWYTPWGAPPDTRSLSRGADGALYANVHVGGILRSRDVAASWAPTLDVDADTHQVSADPTRAERIYAATARGFAVSDDGADSWRFENAGLHASYLRAVALTRDAILVTASQGPRGSQAAVYRRPAQGSSFEKCHVGLPDWFDGNIDTHCLAASGQLVALGHNGTVFWSENAGTTWRELASDLPSIQCLTLA
ncbi:MAG TPA: hypothetical protein VGJ84_00510 [Polyangiaceae bacterium]